MDETIVGEDAEVCLTIVTKTKVLEEEETDEFASYFDQSIRPKIMITTSKRPTAVLNSF